MLLTNIVNFLTNHFRDMSTDFSEDYQLSEMNQNLADAEHWLET